MRFADEPAERLVRRQITRAASHDPRGTFIPEMGEFDQAMGHLNEADELGDEG